MSGYRTTTGIYGLGTYTDIEFTPVPQEAKRLLHYFAKQAPGFRHDDAFLENINFHGSDLPLLPGPLKAQALSAVCQAMIGLAAKEVCELRGIETGKVFVDTDQAGLYPGTAGIVQIDGMNETEIQSSGLLQQVGLDVDRGITTKHPMRFRSWAIFPTRDDNVWFQLLSNFHPVEYLRIFGLDADDPTVSTKEEAYDKIKQATVQYSAKELEHICVENAVVGQTVLSPQAWRETAMGKSLARHPMVNYRRVRGTEHIPPVPLPISSDKRPLAGVKVVELARVIAGPAFGAGLAALGADVIKVQSPNLPDMGVLCLTLMAGKRVCSLDLTSDDDRKTLLEILEDADVVIQAFRTRSLERKGFGLEDIVELAKRRNKGMVYVDINCYGPEGYYEERPGYQQIADAASGCCYVCGIAYGHPEGTGILPSLPIADMLTGAVGILVTLLSLRDRARHGGSYQAHVTLTALDTEQLEPEVGLYQPQVVQKVQETLQFEEMKSEHGVVDLLDIMLRAWEKNSDVLRREEYWSSFETEFGKKHKILAPVLKFEQAGSSPRWTHGPVPNGGQRGKMEWLPVA